MPPPWLAPKASNNCSWGHGRGWPRLPERDPDGLLRATSGEPLVQRCSIRIWISCLLAQNAMVECLVQQALAGRLYIWLSLSRTDGG
jgi:hypothetical protein